MNKKQVYLGLIDLIWKDLVKEAEAERDADIKEAESCREIFGEASVEEGKKLACEDYCLNCDTIKEACQELKRLITAFM